MRCSFVVQIRLQNEEAVWHLGWDRFWGRQMSKSSHAEIAFPSASWAFLLARHSVVHVNMCQDTGQVLRQWCRHFGMCRQGNMCVLRELCNEAASLSLRKSYGNSSRFARSYEHHVERPGSAHSLVGVAEDLVIPNVCVAKDATMQRCNDVTMQRCNDVVNLIVGPRFRLIGFAHMFLYFDDPEHDEVVMQAVWSFVAVFNTPGRDSGSQSDLL